MSVRRLTGVALAIAGLVIGVAAPASAILPPAPNDAFADAIAIPAGGLPWDWEGNTGDATVESGEPNTGDCSDYDGTVWFTIKMATTTFLRADSVGTNGSEMGVFRGTSPDALTTVDCGNDANTDTSDGRVVWRAKAGVTYRIRLSSRQPGAVVTVRKVPAPANDDFAKATAITSFPRAITTDLMNATRETGEPQPSCADPGSNSIWYKVTLPTTRTIQVDATDTALDTYLLVTTGSKVSALTVRDCQDDISEVSNGSRITFTAKAGVTYRILLAGYGGEGGKVRLVFRSVTPPANDAFANARTLPQDGSLVKGDTTTATTQMGEPLTADQCLDHYVGSTVWYTFVANATARYTMDTYGSWPGTTIGIYTGTTLGSLAAIACVETDLVEFDATSGTRYWIQVGGYDADNGPIRVHLDH